MDSLIGLPVLLLHGAKNPRVAVQSQRANGVLEQNHFVNELEQVVVSGYCLNLRHWIGGLLKRNEVTL